MKIKFILLIICGSILMISCSACKTDSATNDNGSFDKKANSDNLLPQSEKLAPGMAKILASFSPINDDNNSRISINVDKVLGYGSATPVLSVNQKISLKLSVEQKNEILKTGNSIKVLIKSVPPGIGIDDDNLWQLISVE